MNDDRLVMKVVRCLVQAGGVGWWAEYEEVLGKFSLRGDLDVVSGSKGLWKEAIKEKKVEDWWEQVGDKSSLGWYGRDFIVEVLDSYAVRLRFRLRTGTAGLLVDKKRCGMCKDSRCVMCDRLLLDRVRNIEGTGKWVVFLRVERRRKRCCCCWGKGRGGR